MTQEPSGESAIEVRGLSYTYAGRTSPTIEDASFSLAARRWTVVAGRTGSGKSTLLRALAGLIPNQAAGAMRGQVTLFGLDTRGAAPLALARHVGLVLQSPDDQIVTTMVENEVAFGLENLGLPPDHIARQVTASLAALGLSDCRWQGTQTLSGGQKQRLMLASILAMGPRLLLLDEPLAQLDPAGAQELLEELERLRRLGLSIVIAEHRLDDLLPRADRVLVLDGGRLIADGDPRDANVHSALRGAGALVDDDGAIGARSSSRDGDVPRRILDVEQLACQFAGQPKPVWSEVSFGIDEGERVAVVGANGSGKSTLLAAIVGIVRPQAGYMMLAAPEAGTTAVGLVPQNPDLTLFSRTVHDELAFGPRRLRLDAAEVADRVHEAAAALGNLQLLDEPPLALSQGQRLCVAVAAAMTLRPRLLLLDEPTTGQDQARMRHLLATVSRLLVASRNSAVLFSTHDLRVVRSFATRALVLHDGRLVADCTPAELLADEALLRRARLRVAGHQPNRGERGSALAPEGGRAHEAPR
ncbi:MAG: ATP-binding cassette domain-containing protein [Planctomycetia bacterium]|nr:ATP-binding cassette domain-containing protein [Planctomycetia bacterium]